MQLDNFIGWGKTIHFMLMNRGRKSYGHHDVIKMIDRHLHENSKELSDYQAAESAINEFIASLKPKEEHKLSRIGPNFDAGYIGVFDSPPNILISGGAGKNIDFEIALAERGTEIHIFDHTVRKLPKLHSKIIHHRIGLFGKGLGIEPSRSLSECISMASLGETKSKWLKLDIEGSEWEFLSDEIEILDSFEQLFIEFHHTYKLTNSKFRKDFLTVFNYLNHNFDLISVSSNNWRGVTNFGMAFLPDTFEVTYIRKNNESTRLEGKSYKEFTYINNPNRLPIPELPFKMN